MSQGFAFMSPKNQFSFKCPVMDQEVQMRTCVFLRDRVFMGKRTPARHGCQACIRAGKCPAAEMVRRVAFKTGDATDHCASDEPKVGRLPGDVLDRILPNVVSEQLLRTHEVPHGEVELIRGSYERIAAQALTAPRTKVEARPTRHSASPTTSRKFVDAKVVPQPKIEINQAAASGDLAAAINAA